MSRAGPEAAQLQARIDAALRESPGEGLLRYSDYGDSALDLTRRLMIAAEGGGAEAVARALDEFDRLRPTERGGRLRQALMEFVTHHPAAVELGLRIPSLETRDRGKVLPSRRKR
jgi:hypothetical protein